MSYEFSLQGRDSDGDGDDWFNTMLRDLDDADGRHEAAHSNNETAVDLAASESDDDVASAAVGRVKDPRDYAHDSGMAVDLTTTSSSESDGDNGRSMNDDVASADAGRVKDLRDHAHDSGLVSAARKCDCMSTESETLVTHGRFCFSFSNFFPAASVVLPAGNIASSSPVPLLMPPAPVSQSPPKSRKKKAPECRSNGREGSRDWFPLWSAPSSDSATQHSKTPSAAEKHVIELWNAPDGFKFLVNSSVSNVVIKRWDCADHGCSVQVKIKRSGSTLVKEQRGAHNHPPPAGGMHANATNRPLPRPAPARKWPVNVELSEYLLQHAANMERNILEQHGLEDEATLDQKMRPVKALRAAAPNVRNANYQISRSHAPFSENVCHCTMMKAGLGECDYSSSRASRPCGIGRYNIKGVGKWIAKLMVEYKR